MTAARIPLVFLMLLSCSLNEIGAQPKAREKVIKPAVAMYGKNSKIARPMQLLITDSRKWDEIWVQHSLGKALGEYFPEGAQRVDFDFKESMVLALFGGEEVLSRGFSPKSIVELDDVIRVRLDTHRYSIYGTINWRDYPWGVILLPRSSKPVVVEYDVSGSRDGPPKWKLWKKLEAKPPSTAK